MMEGSKTEMMYASEASWLIYVLYNQIIICAPLLFSLLSLINYQVLLQLIYLIINQTTNLKMKEGKDQQIVSDQK